jgi:hypothetical protein
MNDNCQHAKLSSRISSFIRSICLAASHVNGRCHSAQCLSRSELRLCW